MSPQEKSRWVRAWITLIMLAACALGLTFESTRWVAGAILGAYLVIVEIALGHSIWGDWPFDRSSRDRHDATD